MRCQSFVLGFLCAVGALVATAGDARAETPWQKMSLFKKVDADPNKDYPLTEAQGPWMIMAVTFAGDTAEKEAQKLVYELRSRYKLPAYIHRLRFDYSQKTDGLRNNRFGGRQKMKHRVDEITEIGVLVGSYPTADDPDAKKTLEQIKFAQPDCMNLEKIIADGEKTSRPLAALRLVQQAMLPDGSVQKLKGPMGHAFITSNPLLPKEYFVPKGVDPVLVDLNKGIKNCLLECPGAYTVKVATFTGQIVVDQTKIDRIQKGEDDLANRLAEAAQKAHLLTEALRAKGYLAYEFHDRGSSIVCVGSFDSVGTPRADGKIEINPQVHAIMEAFGAKKQVTPTPAMAGVGQPQMLAGIPFDLQPVPVQVPKISIGTDYRRETALSSR